MDKFIAFIEKHIAPRANKISNQKYVKAVVSSFLTLIPFFTIGSFALILGEPPVEPSVLEPGLLQSFFIGWWSIADACGNVIWPIFNVTMGLIALWLSIGIGYFLCKEYKMNTLLPIVVTVGSFIIGATLGGEFTMDYFGGTGIFTSIIMSLIGFELYRFLVDRKFGYISLDGLGVPPALSDSLGNLAPVAVVLVVVGIINQIFFSISGVCMPELLTVIMTPIVTAVDSVWGVLILSLLVMVLWWFGIHDTVITGPMTAFLTANFMANAAAYATGTPGTELPYILTEPFWWTFMAIGGSGATFGLAVLCNFSKSKQIKTIGKLAVVPAFFNINEPIIFGLPMMYNPTMMIPFIFVMPLNGLITYLCMNAGIVSRTFVNPSWNMFGPLGALISTMDVKALILVLVLIVIDILIYLPFFKVYEKQKIAEESLEA